MKQKLKPLFILLMLAQTLFAQVPTFERAYGDTLDNVGKDVKQTIDSGYVLIGRSYQNYPSNSISDSTFLLRLNQTGDTTWVKKYPVSSVGNFNAVIETHDNGFAVTGNGTNNFLMARLNSVGDTLWTYHYQDTLSLEGYSIIETDDRGFIVAGRAFVGTSVCCYGLLIKVDSSGLYQWGGYSSYSNQMNEIKKTITNKYIIAGNNYISPPILDVTKINPNNTLIWNQSYFSTNMNYFANSSIDLISDGGFVFGGTDIYTYNLNVVKLDSVGTFVWRKNFYCYGGVVRTSQDSSFYTCSNTTSSTTTGDIRLMKLNSNGDSLWTVNYGGINAERVSNMHITNDCGLVAIGTTQSYGAGRRDVYLIKTDCAGNVAVSNHNINETKPLILIYPNPFTSQATITFSEEQRKTIIVITDLLGQVIKSINFTGRQLIIDKEEMKTGVYFVQTTDEKMNVIKEKIIIQ